MTGVLFTLIAVILAGIGARDQVTVARIAQANGASSGLLLTAVAVALITSAAAAWAALTIAPMLTAKARMVFVALALATAGVESLIFSPGRKPEEPTHSLGALAIVLAAQQLTDAARFLVLALAVLTASAIPAGVGGAVGSAVVMAAAWAAPDTFADARLLGLRRAIGAALLAGGAIVAAQALL